MQSSPSIRTVPRYFHHSRSSLPCPPRGPPSPPCLWSCPVPLSTCPLSTERVVLGSAPSRFPNSPPFPQSRSEISPTNCTADSPEQTLPEPRPGHNSPHTRSKKKKLRDIDIASTDDRTTTHHYRQLTASSTSSFLLFFADCFNDRLRLRSGKRTLRAVSFPSAALTFFSSWSAAPSILWPVAQITTLFSAPLQSLLWSLRRRRPRTSSPST